MSDTEIAGEGDGRHASSDTPAPVPASDASLTSTPAAAASNSVASSSDKDMITGLNNRLKQSMNVIKTLKASEAALKSTVHEYQQKETESESTYKAKDVLIAHLQATCDGLKEELRNSETEAEKESGMLTELVSKLEQAQSTLQKQVSILSASASHAR